MTQGAEGYTGQVGAQGVNGSRVRFTSQQGATFCNCVPRAREMISENYIFYSVKCSSILFSFSEGEMGAAGVVGRKGPQVRILGQIICIHSYKNLFLSLAFG